MVNALVTNGAKTAGVKKGSDAYVKLNARQMYDDGIVMYISEESEVIFTKGEPRGGQDVIDPKYIIELRSMTGAWGPALAVAESMGQAREGRSKSSFLEPAGKKKSDLDLRG